MTDKAAFGAVRNTLFQPKRGLYIAPIRHHSPACAWAVRALIQEIRPAHVLIEAPIDFEAHIPLVLDADTKPPVAIVSLVEHEGETRSAAYYPFCAHSPEFVAMQVAENIGAKIRFIDLPSEQKSRQTFNDPDQLTSLIDEHSFDSGDYVNALAHATGCRDGYELWDHLFETRLGSEDWRGFLGDVGVYCAGIRAATLKERISEQGDDARETQMVACLHAALEKGGGVVAVVGGFHAPALLDGLEKAPSPIQPKGQTRSYLIRYGFRALDALNGYAAGLPQPGYYDALWKRANTSQGLMPWRETAQDMVAGFTAHMRAEGHAVSLPAQVEVLRVAEELARMRGRPGASRHDLIDGVRAALVKGETGFAEIWTERLLKYLCGNRLGDIPASAGSPPLVEDARALARSHRIDVSDGQQRRRKLDIRRKPSHLAASRYFHMMSLLEARFAERDVGPDYLNDARTELLFEEWRYSWSPQVESRLIELSALGDRLPAAALGHILRTRTSMANRGSANDIESLIDLLFRGLLAGLGAELKGFVLEIGGDIQKHGSFQNVAGALSRLTQIKASRGPLGIPDTLEISTTVEAAYARLLFLCDTLADTPDEEIAPRLDAIRTINELLRGPLGKNLDAELFDAAMNRVVDMDAPPEILGAILAVLTISGQRDEQDLITALEGRFTGAVLNENARIGVLRGILHAAPGILWQVTPVLEKIDTFLSDLDENVFLDLLPHLRLALTALNPREVDRLAEMIAGRHRFQAGEILTSTTALNEADLARGIAVERALRVSVAADGLEDWLLEDQL